MQDKKGTELILPRDFTKKLSYYRSVMNDFDYAETLGSLLTGIKANKEKLALSEIQYSGLMAFLNNALRQTNWQQYLQIKAERKSHQPVQRDEATSQEKKPSVFLEGKNITTLGTSSFFSYPLSFAKEASVLIKQRINFALENPMQAITMGIAFQASAVAAKSVFSLPPHFQKMQSSSNVIDLANLSPTQGFMIEGAAAGDNSGNSASSAGDFNGDGLSDVIVGAPYANPQGRHWAGSSYVIYGQKGGYLAPLDLAHLNATQGVSIEGAAGNDGSGWSVSYSGHSVSSAGDFNGDGINDVIVGAYYASPQGRGQAGSSYIIYGQKGGYPTSIDLTYLNATQGVIIEGVTGNDGSGYSVSSAGDFNGDGINDVIVGAANAKSQGRIGAGSSYVIYGKKDGYPAPP
jgi:hypothetical protein